MTLTDAFILIGGRSSRLGTDKAFVDLGGMTLTERAIATVRVGMPDAQITMIAGNSTQFAIEAISADAPFIFDLYENRGPLGGWHAALSYAKTKWIFLLACDYPFVSADLIRLLARNISDAFGSVVPEQADGRLQPLCGFYKVEKARSVVEEILERPRVSPPMHEVVHRLDPRIVTFNEYAHLPGADDFFCNINTPADLERATDLARRSSS